MKKQDLEAMGVPIRCLDLGIEYVSNCARSGLTKRYKPRELVEKVLDDPQSFFNDSTAGRFAKSLADDAALATKGPAPYKIWGEGQIDMGAIEQLRNACRLPVSVQGALMPDAHVGYGLPIGGVLATVGTVIPYAVGVDIACRMKLTVTDLEVNRLTADFDRLKIALEEETAFGLGCNFTKRRQHRVMDMDWKVSRITKEMRDTAWSQLGTSGGGNHFVEYGIVTFSEDRDGMKAGTEYVGILSHSGSRGVGGKVCSEYTKRAEHSTPREYDWVRKAKLSWLDMSKEDGQEYWAAMNLMGHYASANHDCIHRHLLQRLGLQSMWQVENHHNFAWKEVHNGVEMIVHRKGATPAGKGVLGVIPGSMADPAYVVEGLGETASLTSAAHGAGRKMSRSQAKQTFDWKTWNAELQTRGVKLLSAGIDEVPGVYKDIQSVMAHQTDLVRPIARFDPKIVKMADGGDAED